MLIINSIYRYYLFYKCYTFQIWWWPFRCRFCGTGPTGLCLLTPLLGRHGLQSLGVPYLWDAETPESAAYLHPGDCGPALGGGRLHIPGTARLCWRDIVVGPGVTHSPRVGAGKTDCRPWVDYPWYFLEKSWRILKKFLFHFLLCHSVCIQNHKHKSVITQIRPIQRMHDELSCVVFQWKYICIINCY